MTTIVNILTGVFEAIIILMLIKVYTQKPKSFFAYVLGALVLAGITNVSNCFFSSGYLNIAVLILTVLGVSFGFTKDIKCGMLISAISAAVFLTTETFVAFLMSILTNTTTMEIRDLEGYWITGAILSKLFAFAVMKVICTVHKKNKRIALKPSYWILFVSIFLVSALTIHALYFLQYYSVTAHVYNNLAVWCSFGLLYSTFFSLYLYEKMEKQAEEEKKQEVLQYQFRVQSEHVNEILVAQTEIKKLRHDLQNHEISIKAYLKNGDCRGALDYLERMQTQELYANNLIETGNITLDAMLNTKRSIAESKGIQFDVRLQIPEKLFVDPVDICIIFGNALDNAIEACEQMQCRERWIKVSLVYGEKALLCKIRNSTENEGKTSLKTGKADKKNHGFGIGNIEAALGKYKNIHCFEQTDKEFSFFSKSTKNR